MRHVPLTIHPDGIIRRAKATCDAQGNWSTVETNSRPQAAGMLETLADGTVIGEAAFRARLRRRAGLEDDSGRLAPETEVA